MLPVQIFGLLLCTKLAVAVKANQQFIHNLSPLQINGNTYTYQVIRQHNVTWSDADEICKAATPDGHLALLDDDVSMMHIQNHLPASGSRMWIAGRQVAEDDWTWISGQQGKVFRRVPEANELCCTLSVTGVYRARTCTYTTPWYMCILPTETCSRQINSSCTSVYSNSNTCIMACQSNSPSTWFQARNNCLHRNGDLLNLDDASITSEVISALEYKLGYTQNVMWIGLRRRPWIWSSRDQPQETAYTYWGVGEPRVSMETDMCMALEATGKHTTWMALRCDQPINGMLCRAPFNCREAEITTDTSTYTIAACPEIPWLDNQLSIITLSVSGVAIVVLLLVIGSLVICLRNAKRLNVLLGSGPKTYFDYFDFGFRRLMPNNQPTVQNTRTMVLTDDMLKATGNREGTKRNQKLDHVVEPWRDREVVLVGRGSGHSIS